MSAVSDAFSGASAGGSMGRPNRRSRTVEYTPGGEC
eukprot:CAMPEP_0119083648 /NCGR_PEP_ID=MMETSP1178-20130426/126463_1 /TAXON_ID=33656 /ORGANISM="unid sp, Strain CCMP2000" /LENGTH=35 /DNA_ID= /DNA_START= /DNA_END= /DNA_ORIENTATION=